MGLFRAFSRSSSRVDEKKGSPLAVDESFSLDHAITDKDATSEAPKAKPEHDGQSDSTSATTPSQTVTPPVPVEPKDVPLPSSPVSTTAGNPINRKRRISLRPFGRPREHEQHTRTLSAIHEHEKKEEALAARTKRVLISSNSDKKAKESALALRALMIGSPTSASPKLTTVNAKPHLRKLKSQLMKPKSANKVIAHLRELSMDDARNHQPHYNPIHAVCLEHTDLEEHELHFAHMRGADAEDTSAFPGLFSVSIQKLSETFDDMHVVDLVSQPDLGFGQPGDGAGILAGSVPTAETIINGIQQITPQLLALGYATGRVITPDHSGVYPPTDRMSVLTYWWGLEVALPPPSMAYLSDAQSIAGTVMNFLSALAVVNNGVREILPFVRYISQFIDYEFKSIKAQDKGKGVVCAATWIMPAAMVPRPWDFSPPPPSATMMTPEPNEGTEGQEAELTAEDSRVPSLSTSTAPPPLEV